MTVQDKSVNDGGPAFIQEVQAAHMEREDVEFYTTLARHADGPVLELGCGTGRVYLSLLAAGVEADGLDRSGAVLDRLRENASERGLDPTVWQDNMFEFSVDRQYDLVICPFNAVQHASTVDTQLSLLAAVYDALAPGGSVRFRYLRAAIRSHL